MGSNCQKISESISSRQIINETNKQEKEKLKLCHPSQALKYCFPQKMNLESIKTKLQVEKERNNILIQPTDPGSPVEALSETQSLQSCNHTKQHNSCPTRRCGFHFHNEELNPSIKFIKSIKNIEKGLLSQKKLLIHQHKGIIKNSLLQEFSKSPRSQGSVKSVRFLVSADRIRVKGGAIKKKSLVYYKSSKNSKRCENSTIISNCDQDYQYKIFF